jgi:hypothetical protein
MPPALRDSIATAFAVQKEQNELIRIDFDVAEITMLSYYTL